jgi:hypothetical protein
MFTVLGLASYLSIQKRKPNLYLSPASLPNVSQSWAWPPTSKLSIRGNLSL